MSRERGSWRRGRLREGTLPTSGRFLYYELVQPGVVEKPRRKEQGRRSDQDMAEALTHLRETGLISGTRSRTRPAN